MIILEDYRKTEKLLRKLGGLAKGFGFTITVSDGIKEDSSEDEALKLEILELSSKNEVLEDENTTLTENHEQLSNELIESKGLVSERDAQVLDLNSKIDELNNQLNSEVESKEPRKRRTKAEMEAAKELE